MTYITLPALIGLSLASACAIGQTVLLPSYHVGLNFGADEVNGNNVGTLAPSDKAGVTPVAQVNWNNLTQSNGTNTAIVADRNGTAEATGMSIVWSSNNTWSSTGRGEENNVFAGPDRVLMTGYLDTGSATRTTVKIANIPAKLVDKGYDVYVYAVGGRPGSGGSYRILDLAGITVIRDSIRARTSSDNTSYSEVPTNLGAAGNGPASLVFGEGNYLVFRGLTASAITVEARTAIEGSGVGYGEAPRAPINAIQLVAPSGGPQVVDVTMPDDPVGVTSPTSRSPDGERVQNAIDNNILTKFLDFNDSDTNPPFTGSVGLTVRTSGGASVVTGLALTSANDAPERDPASFTLEGSNNGATFTLIAEGLVPVFSRRYFRQEIEFSNTAAYEIYRLTFPTVANAAMANSMQISEVELLGTIGDIDRDGLPDQWEIRYFGGIAAHNALGDPDEDHLTNKDEYESGTDPMQADTDGDGFRDDTELRTGSNPLDKNSVPIRSLTIAVQQVRVEFPAAAGLKYRVESSPDFMSWQWVEEVTGAGEMARRIYNIEGEHLYFRVVQP